MGMARWPCSSRWSTSPNRAATHTPFNTPTTGPTASGTASAPATSVRLPLPSPSNPLLYHHNSNSSFPPTVCTAYWCPCILFGRTEARMRNEDPAAAGTCNGPCAIYCGLLACTGLQCVYQAIRRGDKKDRWGISEGGGFGDWCGAWCCPVCGLVQEEKEALLRQNGVQAVPPKGYEKQEGMQYGQGGSA